MPIEALVVLALCGIAFWKPRLGEHFFRACSRQWCEFARHKTASVLTIGAAALLIRAAILPIAGIPDPTIHDEFGHLLIADTFASGRITNPPHPYWPHFESIYVLQQPTYTSQYPVAYGLVFAAAQIALGNPWWGVLIGMAVYCALMCWMLQAWLPPRWALLGGALAVVMFAIISYWENTYWGGAVPGIGGLLVLGALARLRRGRPVWNSILIALGLAILMNSRPAEALIFGLVVCAVLLWWTFKTKELKLWPSIPRVWLPLSLVLGGTLAAMFYYDYRVTGHPLELPYMVNQKLYGSPQAFWWQRPVVVKWFRHKEMEDDYLRQLRLYNRKYSALQLSRALAGRIRDFWIFFITPIFTGALLFFPFTIRDRGMPLMLGITLPFAFDYLTFHAFYPHYAAPIAGVTMFILLACWRHLRVWKWNGKPVGLFLARTMPLVPVLGVMLVVGAKAMGPQSPQSKSIAHMLYKDYLPNRSARGLMLDKLHRMGGEHLVFVRYRQPGHSPDDEWVYNRADIDHARVVWAREMDTQSNEQLMRYFWNRKVWVAEPDADPPRLSPYAPDSIRASR